MLKDAGIQVDPSPEGHYVCFVLNVKQGTQDDGFNGRMVLKDGPAVRLKDGAYTIRVWIEPGGRWVRGTVHHENTNQTTHFQSGDRVIEFIRGCLSEQSTAADPRKDQPPSQKE